MGKDPQLVIYDHCQCFLHLFYFPDYESIHAQTQQQKNEVKINGLLRGGVTGGSSGLGLVITNFKKFCIGFK